MRETVERSVTQSETVNRLHSDYVTTLTVSEGPKTFADDRRPKFFETVSEMNRTTSSKFRIALPADANEISDLVNAAYRGDSGRKGWTTESDLLGGQRIDADRVRSLIEQDGSVILLKLGASIETGETVIIGCVHLERKNETSAYLGMLTTDSRQQAIGTGSSLLSASELFVRLQWQLKRIEMTVITLRTELIDWYVRRGYQVTGEKRPFPTDPRFGIPLVSGLEFVVLEKEL